MTEPKNSHTTNNHLRFLPGDLTMAQLVDRMIRVDHAGEFGAARIYDGQLAVFGGTPNEKLYATWRNRNADIWIILKI